jgi:hypothetical protein
MFTAKLGHPLPGRRMRSIHREGAHHLRLGAGSQGSGVRYIWSSSSESPRSSCRENSTSAAPYFRGGLPRACARGNQDTDTTLRDRMIPHRPQHCIPPFHRCRQSFPSGSFSTSLSSITSATMRLSLCSRPQAASIAWHRTNPSRHTGPSFCKTSQGAIHAFGTAQQLANPPPVP